MRRRIAPLLAAGLLALGACGSSSGASSTAAGPPDLANWASVTKAAKGQTVNWYLWGGSDSINSFVDQTYGPMLSAGYGVTLHRVGVADTVDAVNQVLAEKKAGKATGAVDLIWINGENFKTLKQAGMLLDGWARKLPNAKYVNWDNRAVNTDFGTPVGDLESPWSSAQFQFVYDTARMESSELPRSYAALSAWACAHPGRFTYIAPGPGAFQGTRFVKGALYELSGGPARWQAYDRAAWDTWSPKLWAYLQQLAPCLWRKGETYPKDENELHKLFANNEIDFTITQAAVGPGALIDAGQVPKTAKAFVFDANSIGDFNYVAVPSNAPHKAAALVLANLLLEPASQAKQIVPSNGFGLGYAVDVAKVTEPSQRKLLDDAAGALGPAATPSADLAKALVGDAAAEYQDLVEKGWAEHVAGSA